MQNKCNCQNSGFVPVSGNWDFSMNGECGCHGSGYNSRANRRSNHGCRQCGEYENGNARGSDCQCERCDDARTAECCEQNTYVRDMDDCECSNGNYTRTRNNGCNTCDECESAYTRTRSNGCSDCGKDNGGTYARSHKNRGVGIVNGVMQEIDEIFQSESALRAGTLFPELHKPLNGYCPCDSNCGTCAQQAAFAAWELRLYLNTHPNDEEALKLFRKLCKEAEEENYATTFLTDDCCTSNWNWVENPWPWEFNCKCGD